MDIRKVKKLIELLEESGLSELEITEGEESIRISRASTATAVQVPTSEEDRAFLQYKCTTGFLFPGQGAQEVGRRPGGAG